MSERIGPFGSVTVFGGATVDRIAATSAPPVEGASNPGVVRVTAGGVGFNLAAVLARFGRPVRLVTSVGSDDDGRRVLAAARDAGIDMSATRISADVPTATYQAALDDRGGLIIGIADMRIFDGIDAAAVEGAIADPPRDDFWVVDANLPAATLDHIVSAAERSGRGVAALTVSPAKAVKLSPLLPRLSLLITNCREAMALAGRNAADPPVSMEALAADFSARLTPNVVITDGAAPLWIACGGEVRSKTPFAAAVRSVNGAGDAFAAGTIHGLGDGATLFDAVAIGLAAAALTVEAEATLPARLTAAAIAARLAEATRSTPA